MEHKEAKNNKSEQEKKKNPKNEDSINSLWNNLNKSNICIIGVPGEAKEQEIGNLSDKIVKEDFPNLLLKIDMQVQEAQRVPNKMDAKRPTPRHIIIKSQRLKIKRNS